MHMKLPDRDYPYADLGLGRTPKFHNGPGWREIVYAAATAVLLLFLTIAAFGL
jgi:hypothetical protein